jgi:hypothetical protein
MRRICSRRVLIFSRRRSVLASISAGWVRSAVSSAVALDAFFDLLLAFVDLAGGEVTVAAVYRLELAAVDGNDSPGKELQVPPQLHEAAADVADALAVVMAKVGNGLEIGRQSTGQPHQLDVALRLALKPSAGRYAVQIPVDVNLKQHRRVVRRPARRCRIRPGKAQLLQIELFDEGVDCANRIVFGDVIVQIFRQQCGLASVLTVDESALPRLPLRD